MLVLLYAPPCRVEHVDAPQQPQSDNNLLRDVSPSPHGTQPPSGKIGASVGALIPATSFAWPPVQAALILCSRPGTQHHPDLASCSFMFVKNHATPCPAMPRLSIPRCTPYLAEPYPAKPRQTLPYQTTVHTLPGRTVPNPAHPDPALPCHGACHAPRDTMAAGRR